MMKRRHGRGAAQKQQLRGLSDFPGGYSLKETAVQTGEETDPIGAQLPSNRRLLDTQGQVTDSKATTLILFQYM